VKIGHICLTPPGNEISEHFAALVEALARHNSEQHVLVASVMLAKRLAACQSVAVGPIVNTPVMAYCLMPNVDLAHIHESKSGQAGLLLTLTRSIPFVITTSAGSGEKMSPLTRSVLHRAAHVVERPDTEPGNQAAREHLGIYQDVLTSWQRSA
jgi:hypothetical protein